MELHTEDFSHMDQHHHTDGGECVCVCLSTSKLCVGVFMSVCVHVYFSSHLLRCVMMYLKTW